MNILFQKEELEVCLCNSCSKQDYHDHHGNVSHIFIFLDFDNIWWWMYYSYTGIPSQLLYINPRENNKANNKISNLNFLSCSFFLLLFFYCTFLFRGVVLASGSVVTSFSMLSDRSLSHCVFCARLDKPHSVCPQMLCAQTPHHLGDLCSFLTLNWVWEAPGTGRLPWMVALLQPDAFFLFRRASHCWHSSHPLPVWGSSLKSWSCSPVARTGIFQPLWISLYFRLK